MPPIASRVGVDLNPVSATDADQRLWLRALVWPENRADARLLEAALTSLATDRPVVIAGDAIDVCPGLGRDLPPGEPRVVFHAATRMHVPPSRRAAFDEAIDSVGERVRSTTSGRSRRAHRMTGTRPTTGRSSSCTGRAGSRPSPWCRSTATGAGWRRWACRCRPPPVSGRRSTGLDAGLLHVPGRRLTLELRLVQLRVQAACGQ